MNDDYGDMDTHECTENAPTETDDVVLKSAADDKGIDAIYLSEEEESDLDSEEDTEQISCNT